MHILKSKFRCQDCIKPTGRRLGLFRANDDFECYAESYVKCFWGMCEQHKSLDDFITKPIQKVITTQPLSDNEAKVYTLSNPNLVQEIVLSK